MSGRGARRAALVFACAAVCALPATRARAADLLAVVDAALDHDARLAASRDAYRAAMQAVPKARAALLPHVTGGWGRAWNGIDTQGYPAQHYWQNGWTVGLVQPLFDWTSWTAYRQADLVVARGRLETASATQDTILAAAQAYFAALAAADETTRAADYLRALDAHLALVARARAAGEATLVDVREGEASRAQAQLQWLDAGSQARLANAVLERQTGAPVTSLASSPRHAAPALQPPDADAWMTQAQTRGYGVQIAEVALRIAKYDTEKARAGRYPTVDIQVTHTPAGAAGGYTSPTTTTTGMLQVVIPLYSGGEVSAKVEEALALEDKARHELNGAVLDAGAGAQESWLRVVQGEARTAALVEVVQREEAALEATRIGFGAGSRTSIDVLRATDTLYASRRDEIRARYDTVLALLSLLARTATLDLDEVRHINAQLFAGQKAANASRGLSPPDAAPALPTAREAVRARAVAQDVPAAVRAGTQEGMKEGITEGITGRIKAGPQPAAQERTPAPLSALAQPSTAAEMAPAGSLSRIDGVPLSP